MKRREIIPYNPNLKELARKLRNHSTLSEIMLWNYLKGKQICGCDFDRERLNAAQSNQRNYPSPIRLY